MKHIILFLSFLILLSACKEDTQDNSPISQPSNYLTPPSLIQPLNNTTFTTDSYLVFNWTESLNVNFYLLVFANDSAMRDTVKSFKLTNNSKSVLLSSLGENYIKYWTVYSVDSNEKYNPISNVNKLIFDGFVKPTFVTRFISPELNATIIKDEVDVIQFKWTKQPEAIGYEIHLDYSPAFNFMSINHIDNNLSPTKLIIVNSPDTSCSVLKHKINWNTKMYVRIRAIYANKVFSDWSDILELNVADPRPKYLGNYEMKVIYKQYIFGMDTTIVYNNLASTITNADQSGLLVENSQINWVFNPFYFSYGTETYHQHKFYGNPDNKGRPVGNVQFKNSTNGDTTYVNGSILESFNSGTITYIFSGFKEN